jgi:hypothetical protein
LPIFEPASEILPTMHLGDWASGARPTLPSPPAAITLSSLYQLRNNILHHEQCTQYAYKAEWKCNRKLKAKQQQPSALMDNLQAGLYWNKNCRITIQILKMATKALIIKRLFPISIKLRLQNYEVLT